MSDMPEIMFAPTEKDRMTVLRDGGDIGFLYRWRKYGWLFTPASSDLRSYELRDIADEMDQLNKEQP